MALTSSNYASTAVGTVELKLIESVLHWPPEYVFPGKTAVGINHTLY